jgi:hypothetical protein
MAQVWKPKQHVKLTGTRNQAPHRPTIQSFNDVLPTPQIVGSGAKASVCPPRFVTQIIALVRCPVRKTESSKATTISTGPVRTVETSRVGSGEASAGPARRQIEIIASREGRQTRESRRAAIALRTPLRLR